ncbi:MAG: hypothetical protein ACK5O7_01020 [Holosporales bacterium]
MSCRLAIALCLVSASLWTSGCAVYKAASNEGVDVSDIDRCTTKACFLSHGMEIVDQHELNDGKYTETYRAMARKSGLNYVRAAGHGVLDVMTLGIWEVAGTPVENAISNNRGFITVKATYAAKGNDKPELVEIYDAEGHKVQ